MPAVTPRLLRIPRQIFSISHPPTTRRTWLFHSVSFIAVILVAFLFEMEQVIQSTVTLFLILAVWPAPSSCLLPYLETD